MGLRAEHNPDGIPEVVINGIGRMKEIGLVVHPADEEASVRVIPDQPALAAA